MRLSRSTALSALLPLVAVACGGLDTPDLSTGAINGVVTGVPSSGAYVYVLGDPRRLVDIRPDGSFTLAEVPVGTAKLVIYDGGERAELVAVEVRGAERSELRKRANDMPKAARVVAAARCGDGKPSDGTEFELLGASGEASLIRGTKRQDAPVVLFPVPRGSWIVRAHHDGYRDTERLIELGDGEDKPVEVEMENELAGRLVSRSGPGY